MGTPFLFYYKKTGIVKKMVKLLLDSDKWSIITFENSKESTKGCIEVDFPDEEYQLLLTSWNNFLIYQDMLRELAKVKGIIFH